MSRILFRPNLCIFSNGNTKFETYRLFSVGVYLNQDAGSKEINPNKNSENNEMKIPPRLTDNNWISPPHPVSNLRFVHFFIPNDELKAVREYREKVEEIQTWNQNYWEKHNSEYSKLKEEFTKIKLKEIRETEKQRETLNASEMAIFYKQFLNDNRKKHMKYNREWYMKNIGLLWWAFRANFAKLCHKLKSRKKFIT